ncbi:hypothetical protein [Frankia sp. Cr2]|uniref:hypothetical protein n=1 Tax=Frankia sp. Cr2 TaxID=3073932 RepID=UPI002AD37850|nr:hypothetical protein [Frankia sp. Cr2]
MCSTVLTGARTNRPVVSRKDPPAARVTMQAASTSRAAARVNAHWAGRPSSETRLPTVFHAACVTAAARARTTPATWTGVHGLAVLSSRGTLDLVTTETPEALLRGQFDAHLGKGPGQRRG